jgi:CRISPR-associated exonuclease Cas4
MQITGTHINYFLICHRKLWLFANGIHMEHNSELVDEGRLIHETAYPKRAEKYQEVALEGIKVDFYDPGTHTIHEMKKGKTMEAAHEWQLKYYIYVFEKNGVKNAKGILEYPKLRQKKEIQLDPDDRNEIESMLTSIQNIIQQKDIPGRIDKKLCKKCSYYDFCYVEENE